MAALRACDGEAKLRRVVRTSRKLAQEHHAYRRWTLQLAPHVPRLVTVEDDPPALVMTELPGRPPADLPLALIQERDVHARAGALLARLHGVREPDEDGLCIEDALRRRAESLLRRAARTEAEALAEWAAERIARALEVASGQRLERVPCHRDFEPRNWLVQLGPPLTVSLVDFEHARMDLALADLTRLRCLVWANRPDLEEAFFRGYGVRLGRIERVLLEALSWLDAVGTTVWGIRQGDLTFTERGRCMVRALARAP